MKPYRLTDNMLCVHNHVANETKMHFMITMRILYIRYLPGLCRSTTGWTQSVSCHDVYKYSCPLTQPSVGSALGAAGRVHQEHAGLVGHPGTHHQQQGAQHYTTLPGGEQVELRTYVISYLYMMFLSVCCLSCTNAGYNKVKIRASYHNKTSFPQKQTTVGRDKALTHGCQRALSHLARTKSRFIYKQRRAKRKRAAWKPFAPQKEVK